MFLFCAGYTVTGVDLAEDAVSVAREGAWEAGLAHVFAAAD